MAVGDGAFLGKSGHSSRNLGLRVFWQQIAEFSQGADADPGKFSMDSRFEGMCRAHTVLLKYCELILDVTFLFIKRENIQSTGMSPSFMWEGVKPYIRQIDLREPVVIKVLLFAKLELTDRRQPDALV